MSSDEQSDKECPLCMEAFDDDINFFPCSCQYQICRFCWHRLRTDENGLCPACRQPYPEDPVNFQPLSCEEIQKIKSEKKQKLQQQKTKLSECRKHLSAYRVLQKNLVYVVGLSQRMADADLLKKTEFFGKFGKIMKIAAIQAVNNLVVDGRLVKASLGTTKYCSNFLKGQSCHKQECMYLHEVADDELSFTKEDMHLGKHTECEKKLHDQMNTTTTHSQPPQPVNSNGSSSTEVKNGRIEKTHKVIQRSSFEAQESSSKSDNAWNEKNCNPKYFSSDDPIHSNERSQSSPVNFVNQGVPETSFQMGSFTNIMTCDELERFLLTNSVPPGFAKQDTTVNTTPDPVQIQREAPVQSSGSFNFFLDLYDDLGFDPFSESSKALADMLEEEKTSSRHH
uniref:CCR4-NOT transcription complex subunit 4 n=1 Tax=Ditylenchus dipsaci TaxID=166011 RepID=A0A915DJB2_9BILA